MKSPYINFKKHLLVSQSVSFGYMQSTSLPVASDGPDDLDEVDPAGLERTVAAGTDIGIAVSVLDLSDLELHSVSEIEVDLVQLDRSDSIVHHDAQMTSTPVSNHTSSQISCQELIEDCDAWLNQNSQLSDTCTSQKLNDQLVLDQRGSPVKVDQSTQASNHQLEQLADSLEQLTHQLRTVIAVQDTSPVQVECVQKKLEAVQAQLRQSQAESKFEDPVDSVSNC